MEIIQNVKIPAIEEAVWKPYLPAFAPLPESFVAHIFNYPHLLNLPHSSEPLFDQIWKLIRQAYQRVSHFLDPAVATEKTTPKWFRLNFARYAHGAMPAPTTYDDWLKKRMLRTLRNGLLEPTSIAAFYMLRYIFKTGEQRWFPSWRQHPIDQAWFHVWGIRPGEYAPRSYAYPFSKEVSVDTILWTQALSVSRLPGWVSVPGIGSLAWGQTREHEGRWYWDVSEEALSRWDTSLVRDVGVSQRLRLLTPLYKTAHAEGFPGAAEEYRVSRTSKLAETILLHVGEPILAGYISHYFASDKPPTQPYIPF